MIQDGVEGNYPRRFPVSAREIARSWAREVPEAKVGSIPVITTLWRAAKLLSDDRQRTLRRLGMDSATLDLLSTLRRAGTPYCLTTRELAERCLVSAGAISQRVARAEKDGLVLRRKSLRKDRVVLVELTTEGHEYLLPVVVDLLDHEEELVAVLSDDEQDQLVVLLEKMMSVLRSEPESP